MSALAPATDSSSTRPSNKTNGRSTGSSSATHPSLSLAPAPGPRASRPAAHALISERPHASSATSSPLLPYGPPFDPQGAANLSAHPFSSRRTALHHPRQPSATSAPSAAAAAQHPRRAKPRHAATAPTKAVSARSSASGHPQSQPCPQCPMSQSRFFCDLCTSRRRADHVKEIQRLSHARDKAKQTVDRLLGLDSDPAAPPAAAIRGSPHRPSLIAAVSSPDAALLVQDEQNAASMSQASEEELPDPFAPEPDQQPQATAAPLPVPFGPAADGPLTPGVRLNIVSTVRLRARAAQLADRLHEVHTAADESRASRIRATELILEKRSLLARRRNNLDEVWSNLGGDLVRAIPAAVPVALDGPPPGVDKPAVRPLVEDRWRPLSSPGAWPGDDPNGFNVDAYNGHPWSTDIYPTWERQDIDEGRAAAGGLHQQKLTSDGLPAGAIGANADDTATIRQLGVGALVEWLRDDIKQLQRDKAAASEELQRTRAILAKEAFAIFAVRSPPGADLRPPATAKAGSSAAPTGRRPGLAARTTSLTERYMPGAFAFGRDPDRFGGATATAAVAAASPSSLSPSSHNSAGQGLFSTPGRRTLLDQVGEDKTSPTSDGGSGSDPGLACTGSGQAAYPNDWTIAGLVLPLPSDIRRFPRDSINGAITHTVHLLQLLTGYLGISLPFVIGMQGGKISIRPNSLWDGGGGSSKQALHLSSAAYALLSAAPAGSGSDRSTASRLGLGESTFNLGASTLSTLESFIQLPPRSHLSWALASTLTGTAGQLKGNGGAAGGDSAANDTKGSEASAASPGRRAGAGEDRAESIARGGGGGGRPHRSPRTDPAAQAAKAFCSALVMLSYDIAYLAATQGVKVDLVTAGGSGLRLLQQTVSSPKLGLRSHANHDRRHEIQDLAFSALDFDQLVQLLEPMKTGSSKSYASTSTASPSKWSDTGRASTNSGGQTAALEQSYIDAGKAAASVLDIKDPSGLSSKSVAAVTAAGAAAAAKETSPTQRAASRGIKATSTSAGHSSSVVGDTSTIGRSGTSTAASVGERRLHSNSVAGRGAPGVSGSTKKTTAALAAAPFAPPAPPVSLAFLRKKGKDLGTRKATAAATMATTPAPTAATSGRSSGPVDQSPRREGDVLTTTASPLSPPPPPPPSQSTSQKATSSSTSTATTTAGAVIFNGIEIGVGPTGGGGRVSGGGGGGRDGKKGATSADAGRAIRSDRRTSRADREAEDEEEWSLV